jgi:hypothetical protein
MLACHINVIKPVLSLTWLSQEQMTAKATIHMLGILLAQPAKPVVNQKMQQGLCEQSHSFQHQFV